MNTPRPFAAISQVLDERKRNSAPRKPGPLRRRIDAWGERLLGVVSNRSFEQQAEYESHQTKLDYVWNTAGLAAWGVIFPLLTIIVTQLVGSEQAGMFSLAFVAAQLLMFLANYGVRTYQVSDRDEEHSFAEYQIQRAITFVLAIIAGLVFCSIRGYDDAMRTMVVAVVVYKAVDGFADVYEGRLQQMDKLYLAGISQVLRSGAVFVVFAFLLLITRNLQVASIAMAVVAILSLVLFTAPLALLETPTSNRKSLASVGKLFTKCFPLFLALFLYALIDNIPKFMMEGVLSYDNQLYYNALYFPAQAILITVGFIYKPLLTRMADAWNDLNRRKRFDFFIVAMLLIVTVVTIVVILFMGWLGVPLLSILYGLDFEPFRSMSYLMVIAGGITGGIDFLYQVMTVMRRQKSVLRLYLITFAFSLAIPYMLIHVSGLRGAIMGYIIVMAILLALLVLEYISVRLMYKRHPEDDPTYLAAKARANRGSAEQVDGEPFAAGEGVSAQVNGEEAPEGELTNASARHSARPRVQHEAPRPRVRTPRGEEGTPEAAERRGAHARAQVPREATSDGKPEFSAREAARQERIAREGGEVDPRYRARRALRDRQARRDSK